jgi:hypothetical protein
MHAKSMFYPDFRGCMDSFVSEFERVRPGFFKHQCTLPDEYGEIMLRILRGTPVTFSKITLDGAASGFNVFIPKRIINLKPATGKVRMVLLFDMQGQILDEDPQNDSPYLNEKKDEISVVVEVRNTPASTNISLYLITPSADSIRLFDEHIRALAYSFANIRRVARGGLNLALI